MSLQRDKSLISQVGDAHSCSLLVVTSKICKNIIHIKNRVYFAENNDPATTLAVFDMLVYCLERADRNLPAKDMFSVKVGLLYYMKFLR